MVKSADGDEKREQTHRGNRTERSQRESMSKCDNMRAVFGFREQEVG